VLCCLSLFAGEKRFSPPCWLSLFAAVLAVAFRRVVLPVATGSKKIATCQQFALSALAGIYSARPLLCRVQMEKNRHAMRQTIAQYQRHPSDTGSSEVQVAILSERIKYMTNHVQVSVTRDACLH